MSFNLRNLLLALLLVMPVALVAHGGKTVKRGPGPDGVIYEAEQLLTATDLVDTDQLSRWITSPDGATVVYCAADLTAIAGGGDVTMSIVACNPSNVVGNDCVDINDASTWYVGTTVAAVPTNDLLMVVPITTVGEDANMNDVEVVGPVPALWAVLMDEDGATTLTYTVDCVWY